MICIDLILEKQVEENEKLRIQQNKTNYFA